MSNEERDKAAARVFSSGRDRLAPRALSRWLSIGALWLFWLDGEKRKPLILLMWVEGLPPLLTSNKCQRDNARAAKQFAIDSTPTFFVNGQKLSGELAISEFDKVLEPSLK